MVKKAVTLNTPTGFPPGMPIGLPFSPGMRAGDFIFTSGQVGSVDDNGAEVKGIEAQTRQTMENLETILEAADS
ncbi:MAG: RidA family protein, partial [Dehalococcoidales bacterium]|nr:RidA family protein [Dehalococcoidales bacterium]